MWETNGTNRSTELSLRINYCWLNKAEKWVVNHGEAGSSKIPGTTWHASGRQEPPNISACPARLGGPSPSQSLPELSLTGQTNWVNARRHADTQAKGVWPWPWQKRHTPTPSGVWPSSIHHHICKAAPHPGSSEQSYQLLTDHFHLNAIWRHNVGI